VQTRLKQRAALVQGCPSGIPQLPPTSVCPVGQPQRPDWSQTRPAGQRTGLKAVVLRPGSHTWQGVAGFTAPATRQLPPISPPEHRHWSAFSSQLRPAPQFRNAFDTQPPPWHSSPTVQNWLYTVMHWRRAVVHRTRCRCTHRVGHRRFPPGCRTEHPAQNDWAGRCLHGSRIIADTNSASVPTVWRAQRWEEKLIAATQGARLKGPLKVPDERWHWCLPQAPWPGIA
jgi:hypothetical protein